MDKAGIAGSSFGKKHKTRDITSSGKGLKMLKLNLLADWTPVNLEPATIKDIAIITAMAFAAVGLISLVLMLIFNLLFAYTAG